jgi:hypothetical protein
VDQVGEPGLPERPFEAVSRRNLHRFASHLARFGPTTPTRAPLLLLALCRRNRPSCGLTPFDHERLSPSTRERARRGQQPFASRCRFALAHIGPDGMKVNPFFNIDLDRFPTGPARGHDMLLN